MLINAATAKRISHNAARACAAFLLLGAPAARAQHTAVTAQVEFAGESARTSPKAKLTRIPQEVVIWLKPLEHPATQDASVRAPAKRPVLVQKDKHFEPHLLVVEVGTSVDFPNRDPFFHNVFSLFDGKRFDLGLYEAGATNTVRFDRLGVSFLFCNIHPQMSAVVVAVDTPYFGKSDRTGHVTITDVPEGRYELHVWYERSLPEDLKKLTRTVDISGTAFSLGAVSLAENPNFSPAHKNKYGQDYAPPPGNDYDRP
jgi:plastocyanin